MPILTRLSLAIGKTDPDVWTVDLIVDDLINCNPGAFEVFRSESFDNLWGYHHSLGRHIRNAYQLWDSPASVEQLCQGRSEVSPDEASVAVTEALWRRLQ